MINTRTIEEISRKISRMVAETPAADLEKHLRALLQGAFTKLELVSREEFDAQSQVLARTREKLSALEQKLAELEDRLTSRE
jgi:BMFP domain-containing protein YqiC